MKRIFFSFSFFILAVCNINAQELFPLHEAASNIPKGVYGVRSTIESFREQGVQRLQFSLKAMYGITARWEVEVESDYSNHHGSALPINIATHTHVGNNTYYYAGQKVYGIPYPFTFGGLYFYSKYRFLAIDGEHEHLRAGVYGEYSTTKVAHDETEPSLEGDNGGAGGGLVISWLHQKFATSLTTGVILPNPYHDVRYDFSTTYNGSHYFITDLTYGRAVHYDLSFGYLLSPKVYDSYSDLNINIYTEFEGKTYEGAKINQDGNIIDAQTPSLKKGSYVDVYPGIQFIFNSNTRIDFSVGFNLVNRSWTHFYPVYFWGFQRFIFAKSKPDMKMEVKNL